MSPAASLAGHVAIVTGASRGVGKGIALELGAAGATVYVTGRTVEEGAAALPGTVGATAEAVGAEGGRGVPVAVDHRDDAQVEALFARVEREEGRLDLLVNNAFLLPEAILRGGRFFETPLSVWDDMIDVGTRSAFVASWHAARRMSAQRNGLIVNISSSGALEYRWHVVYGVGKAALDRLTRDTAHELRESNVCVASLWPGLVLTERTEAAREHLPQLDFGGAESQRFTGRAVVALAVDPKRMDKSGGAFASRDLADEYGFRDVDGSLPKGPIHDPGQPRGEGDD